MTRTTNLVASTTYSNAAEDATVRGIIESQIGTSKRFARTQIYNLSKRMESLHKNRGSSNTGSSFNTEIDRGRAMLGGLEQSDTDSLFANSPQLAMLDGLDREKETPGKASIPNASFLNTLKYAATTGTVDLAYASDDGNNQPSWLPAGTSIWAGGNVRFGSRDKTSRTDEIAYSTDGISFGIDHRFSETYSLGIGVGYARSESEIGANGSSNDAEGSTIALYGSYMPMDNLFIDGMLGYGKVDQEYQRYVAPIQTYAESDRDGSQLFGSISVGYEFHKPGLTLSPYGRFDFSVDRLDDTTETGVGIYSLTYDDVKQTNRQFSLGFRAESMHKARFGWLSPSIRLEYNHDFSDDYKSEVSYTSLGAAGTRYAFKSDSEEDNTLLIGLGSDFIFRNGIRLGIDYQATHSLGPDHDQALNIWLSKNFDEKLDLSNVPHNKYFDLPINIQLGYTFDDNVNRVVSSSDKLIDSIYDINVGTGTSFDINDNSRVLVNASIGTQRFYRYHELERNSVDLMAQYQYRTSGEFDAFTFGLAGNYVYDNYASELRDADTRSLELSVRQSPTDRITWHASLSRNLHDADNKVFDNDHNKLQLNLDYSLGRSGSLYLGHAIQDGYSVSSVPISSYGYGNALSVIDDAFPAIGGEVYKAARFKSDTDITTLGYNYPMGPDDSIDFSLRYIKSTPDDPAVNSSSYRTYQYSIFYLTRF
jgi:outer membrane autotransporter protein